MTYFRKSRREFLRVAATSTGALLLPKSSTAARPAPEPTIDTSDPSDYELIIKVAPVEIAPDKIVSVTTYNGQFPGPLLRFQGYQQVEIDFVADNPGLTLFHCHQQLHMDFGFMTLFDYLG